jgi:hypothetical protein
VSSVFVCATLCGCAAAPTKVSVVFFLNPIKFQYYVHYGTQSTISTIDFDRMHAFGRPSERAELPTNAERTGGTSKDGSVSFSGNLPNNNVDRTNGVVTCDIGAQPYVPFHTLLPRHSHSRIFSSCAARPPPVSGKSPTTAAHLGLLLHTRSG